MAGGHVDRTLLSSYYQNPGDVYDDTKTEGAYEVLAQQTDDNWDEHVNHRTAAELDHPDGSVTNRKIRNGTITADKFVPGALNNDSQNGLRITAHVAENAIDAHGAIPAARVYNSGNQSIANSSLTTLNFNSENYDTDNIHDNTTNPSRLTCKTAGIYQIIAHVSFASNPTGYRRVVVIYNGGGIAAEAFIPAVTGGSTVVVVAGNYKLAVGDYIELRAQQNSGGALDVISGSGTVLSMVKVG